MRTGRRSGALAAHRHAELRGQLLPGELQRSLQDQLGQVGQAVADLHDRQAGKQVRDRETKERRALKLPQPLDQLLLVVRIDAGHALRQIGRERSAIRRMLEDARIDQLIEQQRMRGDLIGQKIAVGGNLHQPRRARPSCSSSAK